MRQQGFSLIEMVSVMAIMGILMTAMWPSAQAIIERQRAVTMINWIVTAIHLARATAINRGQHVTLCAESITNMCGGDWHSRLLVFTDRNLNAEMDRGDVLIAAINPIHTHGTLKWRAFRNRPFLQFTSHGYTNYQNGNFTYCPLDENLDYARQVVVNVQGRVRLVHTRNKAGVRIDRYGKPLRC